MARQKFNTYTRQKERGLKRKLELINYKGGKCEKCGYNKNIAALQFHHINPDEKTIKLDSRVMSASKMEDLYREVDKCVLLCANCHAETHYQDMELNEVLKRVDAINESESKKYSNGLSIKEPKTILCERCGKEIPYKRGKRFCSKECKNNIKHYPSLDEINEKYEELKSWYKVADFFGITRKITRVIRGTNKTYNRKNFNN
jgi:RNA polymerase-binding transcription factor DksA